MDRRLRKGMADRGRPVMLWRRFREWRERRSVLGDMKKLQRDEEAFIAGLELNPIYLANNALASGSIAKAEEYWQQARSLLPNLILTSHEPLWILIGLKRYDEAEALMREALRRFPSDRFYLTGLAHIAEQRGDFAECLKRWDTAGDGPMGDAEASLHRGICLRALDRLEEAEAQFDKASRIAPKEIFSWIERARASDQRKDWPESAARWKDLADRFDFGPGFAGYARAITELGRIDEAEAYLERALPSKPSDLEIAVTRGFLAQKRGDTEAAIDRWALVRVLAPRFALGYREGAKSLASAERHTDADAVFVDAIRRFPDEAWPLLEFALLAHVRRDWTEAVSRWETVRLRFPEHEAGYSMGREALRQAGRGDEATLLERGP
jgi:tetratricopeptide (TPR) repeat protein